MAAEGPRYAGTIVQTTTGNEDWQNVERMGADDGSETASDLASAVSSETVSLTGFGFGIPGEATITGIIVEIDRNRTDGGGSCRDNVVRLIVSGSVAGNNKAVAQNWETSSTIATYGSDTDVWGATLSAAVVNGSDFGLSFQARDAGNLDIARVDFVRMTVYYTTTAPTGLSRADKLVTLLG